MVTINGTARTKAELKATLLVLAAKKIRFAYGPETGLRFEPTQQLTVALALGQQDTPKNWTWSIPREDVVPRKRI